MANVDSSERRKTKRDKKAKSRYNAYKKGGRHRASKIKITNEKASDS